MSDYKKREFFAYQIIKDKKISRQFKNKNVSLTALAKLIEGLDGNFYTDFKIWSALIIKWHFDFINSHLLNPSKLNSTVSKLYELALVFKNLERSNWIAKNKTKKYLIEKWKKSEQTYDFLWPRTTIKKFQNISKKMVIPRVNQIISMLPKHFLKNKIILDSGCGTGRYIECFLKHSPKIVYGMDKGKNIIKTNSKRFSKKKNVKFKVGDVKKLPFNNGTFDFVCSAGVLHHSGVNLNKLINEHSRVIKKNGYFFIFITSKGGLLKETWDFSRRILKNVPIEHIYNYLENKISPLRMQGFIDHIYTSNQPTLRVTLEKILLKNFSKIKRLNGVPGADLTPEIYKGDRYYKKRFGEGDLRYLCLK